MLLAKNVLIAPDRPFADDAQMRPGHVARATHRRRDFMGKVHELDVERLARIDGGILMGILRSACLAVAKARR